MADQPRLLLDDGRIRHATGDAECRPCTSAIGGDVRIQLFCCLRHVPRPHLQLEHADGGGRCWRSHDFDDFECVFGHPGILPPEAEDILAFQAVVRDELEGRLFRRKDISDARRRRLYDRIEEGTVRFFVVKDTIAHAKIYLLSHTKTAQRCAASPNVNRRVIVGSANLSERAFSGRQAETLIVFDDDERAWTHYASQYEGRARCVHQPLTRHRRSSARGEGPHRADASAGRGGSEVRMGRRCTCRALDAEERRHPASGTGHPDGSDPPSHPPWDGGRDETRPDRPLAAHATHCQGDCPGGAFPPGRGCADCVPVAKQEWVHAERSTVALSRPRRPRCVGDVEGWLAFFENYERGFVGDVERLQRDYFTFMCWFYFAPLMCDLRNAALRRNAFSFDQPMFAVLYGSSNCGKTSLIETLMASMFTHPRIVDTQDFTPGKLRGLQEAYKRFPVVFDDVTRDRFQPVRG